MMALRSKVSRCLPGRHRLTACCLWVTLMAGLFPATSLGQTTPTLIEGWLTALDNPSAAGQARPEGSIASGLSDNVPWSHAFALLTEDIDVILQQRRYLSAEMDTLKLTSRLSGHPGTASALDEWQTRLDTLATDTMRTPGRFDLPSLGSQPRQAPAMSKVHAWGVCTPPDWIEVWSLSGVARLNWPRHATLDDVFDALPAEASDKVDASYVISPQGAISRRGIASWNHQDTRLAPGSRIITELPDRQGLTGALAMDDASTAQAILNQQLAELLANFLPGEHCTRWQNQ